MLEFLPGELLVPEALERVIAVLRVIPVSDRVKKGALREWCVVVGVELTAEMVEDVTGLPAGEV